MFRRLENKTKSGKAPSIGACQLDRFFQQSSALQRNLALFWLEDGGKETEKGSGFVLTPLTVIFSLRYIYLHTL